MKSIALRLQGGIVQRGQQQAQPKMPNLPRNRAARDLQPPQATMTTLKLSYFDFHGGRAEPVRLALHLGGITFDDHRFPGAQFPVVRKAMPLGQVPVLEVDGIAVTQSDAMLRFAGKRANLYPTDDYQALLCDEVISGAEDISIKVGHTFGLTGDALKTARQLLVDGPLPQYLAWLENQLRSHGGVYFADGRLTIADLKIFVLIRSLSSGHLDHVPTDLVAKTAPALDGHAQRLAAHPGIAAYYAKFGA